MRSCASAGRRGIASARSLEQLGGRAEKWTATGHGDVRRNENVGSIQMRADGSVRNRTGKGDQAAARVRLEGVPHLRSERSITNQKEPQRASGGLSSVQQQADRLL